MILLIKLIALTAIWVLGIKIATSEGMVLEKMGKYGEKKVEEGHKIFEALWVCEWCMPSVHSLFGHAFAIGLGILPFEWNWQLLIRYPLVVMGTSIVTGLTWTIYNTINQVKERNEAEAKYYKQAEQLAHFDVKERKERYHQRTKKPGL